MIEQLGMSDKIGPRLIGAGESQFSKDEGPVLLNQVDNEINSLLKDQYSRGMNILTENRILLDKVANLLIEKESITGVELYEMI